MATVKVFGADWCPMTRRTREHLRRRGVDYRYINIEKDPEAAEWVRQQNGGAEKKPTVDIAGRILSEPTNEELDEALDRAA
jgi:mycoredoxin